MRKSQKIIFYESIFEIACIILAILFVAFMYSGFAKIIDDVKAIDANNPFIVKPQTVEGSIK